MDKFLETVAAGLRKVGFDAEVSRGGNLRVCGVSFHCYQGRGYVYVAGTRVYRRRARAPYSVEEGISAVLSQLASELKLLEKQASYQERCDTLEVRFPNVLGSRVRGLARLSSAVKVLACEHGGYQLVVSTKDVAFLCAMADMMLDMTSG